ncbi:MAG: hypothetical protein IPF71_18220 [Rhodoferax sp.]|nr:hypothetical protein [Rhodoferax sp.]
MQRNGWEPKPDIDPAQIGQEGLFAVRIDDGLMRFDLADRAASSMISRSPAALVLATLTPESNVVLGLFGPRPVLDPGFRNPFFIGLAFGCLASATCFFLCFQILVNRQDFGGAEAGVAAGASSGVAPFQWQLVQPPLAHIAGLFQDIFLGNFRRRGTITNTLRPSLSIHAIGKTPLQRKCRVRGQQEQTEQLNRRHGRQFSADAGEFSGQPPFNPFTPPLAGGCCEVATNDAGTIDFLEL